MLVKLEAKTARVKSIAFHSKRPWLLAALHSGAVQIWDYRMGTLVDSYSEHEGPVRGCAFHPSQPIFASCGDDYTVRVYNYRTKRQLFSLSGHMDYVRTVCFHPEAPWLMSASDDQTIRVWNWQSRQCIAVLTGHAHYVMCAQFHPREDLVVSASLDQTIRVWDISGLRRKGSHSGSPIDQTSSAFSPRSGGGQLDLFAPPDGAVKYILEGHDRGVNWVCFHPSKPLIVSSSDDRTVRLWRYNDIRAWEVECFRGHQNNVSAVMFHPRADLIFSDSEDKTMRIWDFSGAAAAGSSSSGRRSSVASHACIDTIRRDGDRFWSLAAHQEANLFAAGHDSGFVVFKMERERPAYCLADGGAAVYYFQDKVLKMFPLGGGSGKSQSLMTADRKLPLPCVVTHNPAEEMVLVSSADGCVDRPFYELYQLRSGEVKRGDDGACAVFTARNRFAVLDSKSNTVHIKTIENAVYRSFNPPIKVLRLLPSTAGTLLLSGEDRCLLWDLQQGRVIWETTVGQATYAVWGADGKLALLCKTGLAILDRNDPTTLVTVDDRHAKSAVFDGRVLFYTNSYHLKFVLPNGECGVVCSIDKPYYLLKVSGDSAFVIDRLSALQVITIDPAECALKLALMDGDMTKAMTVIQSSPLVGQSIIAYLRQAGHPEVALEFVEDAGSRFELALEAGRLDLALKEAERLTSSKMWERLGEEALLLGDAATAEEAFRRGGLYDRLSLLFTVTGQMDRLRDLISLMTDDPALRIQCDLVLGDWGDLCRILEDARAPALAYLAARQGNDEHKMADISARHPGKSLDCNVQSMPSFPPAGSMTMWPLSEIISKPVYSTASLSPIHKSMEHEETATRPVIPPPDMSGWGDEDLVIEGGEDVSEDEFQDFEVVSGESVNVPKFDLHMQLPNPGKNPYAALQAYDDPYVFIMLEDTPKALNMLTERYSITEFDAMKGILQRIAVSSQLYYGCDGFIRSIPYAPAIDNQPTCDFLSRQSIELQIDRAMELATAGHFKEAIGVFKTVLTELPFAGIHCSIDDFMRLSVGYIINLQVELTRRELPSEDIARSIELACYFTHCDVLRPEHLVLALRSALTVAYKAGCVRLAGKLARRLLECPNLPDALSSQARKVMSVADKTLSEDPLQCPNRYDPLSVPFMVCPHSLVQLVNPSVNCPFCASPYSSDCKGRVCVVCEMARV